MAPNGKPNPRTNYPLWIIAISLLAIAICVVIDSIDRQRVRNSGSSALPAKIAGEVSEAPAKPVGVRVALRPRPERSTDAPAENLPANPAADNAAGPEVAAIPAIVSTIGGAQPVGYSVSGIATGSNPLGEIAGRITLSGTPPPEESLRITDPICSKRSTPLMTRNFVVGESNGLADAVVFLKQGINAAALPVPTNMATVLFTNCDVQPYLTAIVARQWIDFRDKDGVEHDLSVSDGSVNRTLLVPQKSEQRFRFTRPRLFAPVVCLKHSWEKSFICVLENPFFAVTDSKGNFDIPNVPPGTYTVEVAHRGATGTNGVTRSVIVVAGKMAELNVSLSLPNSRPSSAGLSGSLSPQN